MSATTFFCNHIFLLLLWGAGGELTSWPNHVQIEHAVQAFLSWGPNHHPPTHTQCDSSNICLTADIPYDQQRLILNGFQCEDDRTLGELAAGSNTPLDSFQPTFSLIPRLRGGMYHATSGRQDNEILIDGGHSFAKVCGHTLQ